MSYIVAFNRDRDSYQVPLALAEINSLKRLVTDYYAGSTPLRLRHLAHRTSPGIAPHQVEWVPRAVAMQGLWKVTPGERLGRRVFPEQRVDAAIGARARDVAALHPDADLLLYSDFALPAFQRFADRRRVLFQFHPHPRVIRQILDEDGREHPGYSFAPEPEQIHFAEQERRHDAELGLADLILCASTFTATSVADARRPVRVVPYGADFRFNEATGPASPSPTSRRPRLLFVGQGVQRKGLHHLLEAYRNLSRDCDLTLVLSIIDPAIGERIPSDVLVKSRLTPNELAQEMSSADMLVLPSLVEGFGLVLAEALGFGCHLVATGHTGLPDLALPPELATVIAPGGIEQLRSGLEAALQQVTTHSREDRIATTKLHTERLRWAQFRHGIRDALEVTS